MKKTITLLSLAFSMFTVTAQTTVADFENLTLGTDTFYENHSGLSWLTANATFRYEWDPSFGGFWGSGFAYTNKNNPVTGNYSNMYASITGKGFNNSNTYVTAWSGYGDENMMIKLAGSEKSVTGFYATNSTYAYKTMLNGGGPARKFGDTLHTHSGMEPGDFPDWFKLTVFGYKGGVRKTDSVEFYLADYRFADNSKDYIVKTWEWVDCSPLGAVDSIFFRLSSSDVGTYGINNPTYFCLDNFTTSSTVISGLSENTDRISLDAYPNPFSASLVLRGLAGRQICIRELSGKMVYADRITSDAEQLDLNALQSGVYFLEVASGDQKVVKKLIKN